MRNQKRNFLSANSAAARMLAMTGIHAAVLVAVLFFCEIKYEVSDDFVMELIASGAFNGKPDEHVMFCSVLWGQVLKALYGAFPGVSWYLILQVAVVFLSFCAVSCYLAQTMSLPVCIFLSVLLEAFFAGDLYVLPQFTKTAAAAVAGGGFLFVWGLFRKRKASCVFGAALVILGCLLRHNTIYVAGPCLFFYIVYESVRLFRRREPGFLKRMCGIFAAGLALVASAYGLRWCNNTAYWMDEDYAYYRHYSYARAGIVDYPLPDYETCAKELEEIGISRNDYELLRAWTFADRNVFSLERMQQVRAVVEKCRPVYFPTLKDMALRFFERRMPFYPGTVCCLILAAVSLWFSRKRLPVVLAAGVSTLALLFYFIHLGHAVYRVEFGYLYAAALLLVYTMPRGAKKGILGTRILYALTALAALAGVRSCVPDGSWRSLTDEEYRAYIDSTFDYSWDYLPQKYTKAVNQRDVRPNFLKEVREHPENLYLLDFNTTIQSLYFDFSPFYSFPQGALGNMIYLGGVTVNHPVIAEALAKWGIGDALPGLLKEHVYFVSNTTGEQVLAYLREHYDPDVRMTLYKELDGYKIWEYRSP